MPPVDKSLVFKHGLGYLADKYNSVLSSVDQKVMSSGTVDITFLIFYNGYGYINTTCATYPTLLLQAVKLPKHGGETSQLFIIPSGYTLIKGRLLLLQRIHRRLLAKLCQ